MFLSPQARRVVNSSMAGLQIGDGANVALSGHRYTKGACARTQKGSRGVPGSLFVGVGQEPLEGCQGQVAKAECEEHQGLNEDQGDQHWGLDLASSLGVAGDALEGCSSSAALGPCHRCQRRCPCRERRQRRPNRFHRKRRLLLQRRGWTRGRGRPRQRRPSGTWTAWSLQGQRQTS